MDPTLPRPARNGHGAETNRVFLGQVTAADSEKGVTVHLRRDQSVEELRQGQFVVIEGEHVRFFGTISGFRLAATDPAVAQDPPDSASSLVHETLRRSTTYAECTVRPSLELIHTGTTAPQAGAEAADGLAPARTIPGHFARAYRAGEQDFQAVFGGEEQGKHFIIGRPRDMDIPVTINLERLVERSNGIFGRSGTGKSILARLLFCGLIKSQACVNLIFDMHSEYAHARRMEDGNVAKGLADLFGRARVVVYSLDEADTTRSGRAVDRLIRIPLDYITLDDLAGLQDELGLSEAGLVAAGQLERRLGTGWMRTLLGMDADAIKEQTREIGAHEGAVEGLRRRLEQRIARLGFVVEQSKGFQTGIDDLIRELEGGHHVVLQFGRHSSLLAYMLVANLITRRIHERWIQLTEQAEAQDGAKVRPLVITIEEAHKFLSHGQSIFSIIARELRKYSVTLLIVDQRPSSIDPDVMSQLGTRITALLSDERDIDAVFTGTRGGHFKNILATLDTRQEVLIFGHAVPMEVVLRTRTFDEAFYRALVPDYDRSRAERGAAAAADLFPA